MTAATFQSTVRATQGFGTVGDLYSNEPRRAEPFQLSTAAIVGRMLTSALQGIAAQGGTDVLAGILFNSKVYALTGDGSNPLNPSLSVAAFTNIEALKMGEMVISVPAACAIGDKVQYATANGILSTFKDEAQFTASQALGVLTVTAVAQGVIGIGKQIKLAGNVIGTVISLGSGAGGTGTYNLDTSATVDSAAMTAAGSPAAGNRDAFGVITRFTPDAVGSQLAVAYFNIPA